MESQLFDSLEGAEIGGELNRAAYDPADYAHLEAHVTAERVRDHFRGIVSGDVVRHALPTIGALNFVLTDALGGGVTRSLALDAHGKGLSSALLDLEIPGRP